jgi:hypothetical protein
MIFTIVLAILLYTTVIFFWMQQQKKPSLRPVPINKQRQQPPQYPHS